MMASTVGATLAVARVPKRIVPLIPTNDEYLVKIVGQNGILILV